MSLPRTTVDAFRRFRTRVHEHVAILKREVDVLRASLAARHVPGTDPHVPDTLVTNAADHIDYAAVRLLDKFDELTNTVDSDMDATNPGVPT